MPLSQLFCQAVDLFTLHQDAFLCQLHQSCHISQLHGREREENNVFMFMPHCVFLPLGSLLKKSKQNSATALMRNDTHWRSRAYVSSRARPTRRGLEPYLVGLILHPMGVLPLKRANVLNVMAADGRRAMTNRSMIGNLRQCREVIVLLQIQRQTKVLYTFSLALPIFFFVCLFLFH